MTGPSNGRDSEWVTLARIVRPQGRKGEVLADLFTDSPDQLRAGPEAFLRPRGKEAAPAFVEDFWLPTGRSAGRIVLKLRGIDSITDAELHRGSELQIPREARPALDKQNHYVADLVGCTVSDHGTEIGKVRDLQFPQSRSGQPIDSAPAIFVIQRADGDEILVPFANEFIASIDVAARRIEMNLPDGMLSING